MCDVYGDIMPVRKVGQTHIWYTPWDFLIRWWGIQEAMIDLVERPELVHAAVERMVDAWMIELDQFEAQNLLSLDCNNTRIGSGGYGYTVACRARTTIRRTSGRTTCGAVPTRRSSPRFRRGCTGSSPSSTISAGCRVGGSPTTVAVSRWTRRSTSCSGFPTSERFPLVPGATRDGSSTRSGGRYVISRKPSPGNFRRRPMAPRTSPAGSPGFPRRHRRQLSRGTHHERHLHRPLSTATALGVGPNRPRSGRGVRALKAERDVAYLRPFTAPRK